MEKASNHYLFYSLYTKIQIPDDKNYLSFEPNNPEEWPLLWCLEQSHQEPSENSHP